VESIEKFIRIIIHSDLGEAILGKEDEIREYLLQGYTPQQVINMGYSKSTVYKVYESVKSFLTSATKPDWVVYITPTKPRCLPGKSVSMNFKFENKSERDLYLYRVGVSAEWMASDKWLAQNVRDLIKPGQSRLFSFVLLVPSDTALGEYELRFGIEGQYLPVSGYSGQSMQTQWSEPIIFHVKHPPTGIKVFISHSTRDMHLVRGIEDQLDNYGIEPIIAEDIPQPGAELEEKFKAMIRESTIFLAFLTESGVTSEWVIKETNYALSLDKPRILLKEESVYIKTSYEWIPFSMNEPSESITTKVLNAIKILEKKVSSPVTIPLGVVILGLILAFIGGLAIGSRR